MKLTRLTGSQLGIARHCGWAYREDTSYPVRPRGDDADTGNAVHDAIAETLDNDSVAVLSHDDMELYQQAFKYLRNVHPGARGNVRPEVTFALDMETGKARKLGSMLERDYSNAKSSEIVGTVDYLVVYDDYVTIGDWKTHFTNVSIAEENAQLAFGALCASQVYGVSRAIVEIVGLQPHRYEVDAHQLERLDLVMWDGIFRRIVEELPKAEAKAGPYCTWCPALGACPATQSVIDKLPESVPHKNDKGEIEKVELKIEGYKFTTDDLGLANDQAIALNLPQLKKMVDAIEAAVKARHPFGISLPNGKRWKPSPTTRTTFNKEKALSLLGDRAVECTGTTTYDTWRQVKDK